MSMRYDGGISERSSLMVTLGSGFKQKWQIMRTFGAGSVEWWDNVVEVLGTQIKSVCINPGSNPDPVS
jgi:hypothetical protein